MNWQSWLLALCLLTGPILSQAAPLDQATFDSAMALFQEGKYDKTAEGIDALTTSGHPKTEKLLKALLEGDLYFRKKDKLLVIGQRDGRKYQIKDALTDADQGLVKKRKLKKVKVNNSLRRKLRATLAGLRLSDPDAQVRLIAVTKILESGDAEQLAALRPLLAKETDTQVKEAAQIGISMLDLASDDQEKRLDAIAALSDSLAPIVRTKLTAIAQDDADAVVKGAAATALADIKARVENYQLAETLFFGLSAGSVLVLAAIGLAITFGVMGVINMAHGELIMLGAYTTYLIQLGLPNSPGLAVALAIPGAFLVSGAMGVAIERVVIRFLYGRPLETLLATFGISLILQQVVRTLISPQNVPVSNPEWLSGSWQINGVLSLTYNRLYIFLFCLIVFAALFLVLKKTNLGLQVRAVSQNRSMARAMGVRSARVDALTFGLGSGIAGIAGVALSQLTNVGPNLGQAYIVDSFMVVVFGGVGNLWGTLIGGLSLGVANKFLEPWSGAVLAKILILVFIILFIQKRPRGLFPQKGRAAEG